MSEMRIAIISADFVCVACLLILLWGLLSHRGERKFSTRAYIICLSVCLVGTLTEAICYILEGQTGVDFLLGILNTCSLLGYTVITAAFMYYMWTLINDKVPVSIKYVHVGAIICAIDIVFYIFGSIFGYIFTVENGVLVYKKLALVGEFVEVALMVYFIAFSLVKGRKAGAKILIAVASYIALPLLSVAAYVVVDEVSFAYVAITLVLLIVYVMIQADEQERLIVQENIMQGVSNTDSLTGINNRRAYETKLTELSQAESAGVLFCDLNGLKTVNDTEGHASGDSYIVRAANILRNNFRENEIYRISGDEFVVLLGEIREEELRQTADYLKKIFAENNGIASVGAAWGTGKQMKETIAAAENDMYTEKSRYYTTSGKERRSR